MKNVKILHDLAGMSLSVSKQFLNRRRKMKTKMSWTGSLQFKEENPVMIHIGKLNINPVLHFIAGKRVILRVELLGDGEDEAESSEISAMGKLDYDQKKKKFLFEKYPLVDFLKSFSGQSIKLEIEIDNSVLSARMTY